MPRKKTKKRSVGSAKATCTPVNKRVKLSGKFFTIKKYHSTKTAAKKQADNHRAKGKKKLARVTKTACGWRVATAG